MAAEQVRSESRDDSVIMSAEDRLQALEQLVAAMQGEVLVARAAAAKMCYRRLNSIVDSEGRGRGGHALWEAEELRRHNRQLETVQVHVPWLSIGGSNRP